MVLRISNRGFLKKTTFGQNINSGEEPLYFSSIALCLTWFSVIRKAAKLISGARVTNVVASHTVVASESDDKFPGVEFAVIRVLVVQ